ncbi:MAG: sigma factor-like helix-turn-helix DNA-binding protein [Nannocystaceae bacterium]
MGQSAARVSRLPCRPGVVRYRSSRDDEDCHLCIRVYVLAAKRGRRQNRAAPFGTPIKTYRSHPPETQRSALGLLLEGLSYREIGTKLEITRRNASVRVTRARNALRHR